MRTDQVQIVKTHRYAHVKRATELFINQAPETDTGIYFPSNEFKEKEHGRLYLSLTSTA